MGLAKCAGSLRCREVVTMTMSKEWIYLHGIFLLPRRLERVRNTATALMVTAGCIYGLKGKEYIRIQRPYCV